MSRTRRGVLAFASLALALSGGAARAARAQGLDEITATRPLATRQQLDSLAQALAVHDRNNLLGRVRARLNDGDFRPGDRVMLDVQGESTLTDTFTVNAARELALPAPATGSMSLRGVLRSELDSAVASYLGRFIRNPVVHATPTVRFSVQGEVKNAGYYGVPADAALTDVLMAAGGTMPDANMKKFHIERNGKTILDGKELQAVIASRSTVDEAGLRDGDQFVIPKSSSVGLGDGLHVAYLLVSLTLGLYGLSKIVHT